MTKLFIVINLYGEIIYTGKDLKEASKAWNKDLEKHKEARDYLIARYEVNIDVFKNKYNIKYIDGTGWLD